MTKAANLLEIAALNGEIRELTALLSATQSDLAQARRELSGLRDQDRLDGLALADRKPSVYQGEHRSWALPEHAALRDKIAHRF